MPINSPDRRVRQMNGQPLRFFTFCDFGSQGRRWQIGNHTGLDAAKAMIAPSTRPNNPVWGQMWIEDEGGAVVAGPYWSGGPRPTKSGH